MELCKLRGVGITDVNIKATQITTRIEQSIHKKIYTHTHTKEQGEIMITP